MRRTTTRVSCPSRHPSDFSLSHCLYDRPHFVRVSHPPHCDLIRGYLVGPAGLVVRQDGDLELEVVLAPSEGLGDLGGQVADFFHLLDQWELCVLEADLLCRGHRGDHYPDLGEDLEGPEDP